MNDAGAPRRRTGSFRKRRHPLTACMVGLVAIALVAGAFIAVRNGGSSKSDAKSTAARSGTTSTIALALVRTPTDAAEQLYFAWQRDDKAGATRLATDAAVTAIFSIRSTSAAGLAFVGCTKPAHGASICSWERRNARLTMRVNAPGPDRPQVQAVELT